MSYRKGRHHVKFGFNIDTIHVISADCLALTYTFANLQPYLNAVKGTARYTQLTREFGGNTDAPLAESRTVQLGGRLRF